MNKKKYQAVGVMSGVEITDCGHWHDTPQSALRCGNKRWGNRQGTCDTVWYYGGVKDNAGDWCSEINHPYMQN